MYNKCVLMIFIRFKNDNNLTFVQMYTMWCYFNDRLL